jgi:ethanolamine utilization protein EutN
MRIGKVIGQLTLSRYHPSVSGTQWKIVIPQTEENLRNNSSNDGEELVVYDDLSVAEGQFIAFSEGAEASKPFYPDNKPVDAYNAAILDRIEIV